MKFRERLLVLMMFISLPPLIFLSVADHLFLRELGEELSIRTHNNLVRDAQIELRQLVDSYARIVEREVGLVSLLLYIQTDEVQRKLNSPLVSSDASEINTNVITQDNLPQNQSSIDSNKPHSSTQQLNFEEQMIYLLPDAENQILVQDQVKRLSTTGDILKQLYNTEGDIVLWHYVTLNSGVHVTYPGASWFPPNYDPRERVWFTQTIEEAKKGPIQNLRGKPQSIKDEVRWFPLVVDSFTGQVTMSATLPVRDINNKIIGVSGIDLKLTEMLSAGRLPTQWSNSRLLLVALADPQTLDPYTGNPGVHPVPVIVADTQLQQEELSWKMQLDIQPLVLNSPYQQNQFVDDLMKQKSGIMNTAGDNEQAVWGYAPIGPSVALLVIVPYNEINARASVIRELALEKMWQLMRISTVVLVGVIIMVVVLSWSRSRTVTEPVLRMARAAERIASGDLSARVSLNQRHDEIGQLAQTLNSMVPKLQDHLRLSESIDLAMQVQQSLLPKSPPEFLDFDIAGQSIYCDETGGDYFDYIELSNKQTAKLGVAIGDVVGHGIAAALLMATTRALLRLRAEQQSDLQSIFKDLNKHLCESRFAGKFMTMFYLVISELEDNKQRYKIDWISAGHDPTIVYDPLTKDYRQLHGTDIPLGVLHDWPYDGGKTGYLDKNKIILLGTDGIWETRNAQRDFLVKIVCCVLYNNMKAILQIRYASRSLRNLLFLKVIVHRKMM